MIKIRDRNKRLFHEALVETISNGKDQIMRPRAPRASARHDAPVVSSAEKR